MKKKSQLLQKENSKYANLISSKKPEEISFEETIKILSGIFNERDSLFYTRYKCLNIVKQENEDFMTYADNANSQCELFKLGDFSIDI